MPRDLRTLPKAHLHLHLAGSMRPATLAELAARSGVRLPPELVRDPSQAWATPRDWSYFHRLYDAARSAIRTPDDVDRVIREAAATDVDDGVVRLEIQVNPGSYAARFGLDLEAAVGRLVDACRAAEDATGLSVALVVAGSWTAPPETVTALARVAAAFAGRGVVGLGLSDDDRQGRPADFAEAFAIAGSAGLIGTPHSGYYAGPDHVRACVDDLGARRIGHGIAALADPDLLARLAREAVTLEFCPASYPPLGVVATLADVPLRALYAAGVPVALAADDPLLFGVSVLGQYRIARDVLLLADAELADLARQSVRACTAPAAQRDGWLRAVDAWMSTPDS